MTNRESYPNLSPERQVILLLWPIESDGKHV